MIFTSYHYLSYRISSYSIKINVFLKLYLHIVGHLDKIPYSPVYPHALEHI
nr:MAG TPA: hypothetical protein [Caudoviricetes sp.]